MEALTRSSLRWADAAYFAFVGASIAVLLVAKERHWGTVDARIGVVLALGVLGELVVGYRKGRRGFDLLFGIFPWAVLWPAAPALFELT